MSFKSIPAVLLLLVASACADSDTPDMPTNEIPQQSVTTSPECYFELNITFPSSASTRSETTENGGSSSGEMDASENENKVNSAAMFFFDTSSKAMVCSFLANKTTVRSGNTSSIYAKIEDDHLVAMAGKKLHLYVVANLDNLSVEDNISETDFLSKVVSETQSPSFTKEYGKGSEGQILPFSNHNYYVVDLEKIKVENDDEANTNLLALFRSLFTSEYTDNATGEKGKLWKMYEENNNSEAIYSGEGPLNLERMVARVDFKPTTVSEYPINVYPLSNATDNNGDAVYLKLIALRLFNLGKESYIFRHTALGTEEKITASAQPFGEEKGNIEGSYNWIAGSDLDNKASSFFNHLSSSVEKDDNGQDKTIWSLNDDNIAYITIENLKKTTPIEGYYPWHYLMENTVESTELMTLQYCTGIEFRFVVCDGNGDPVKKFSGDKPYRITMGKGAGSKEGYYQEPDWTDAKTGEAAEPAGYYLTYRCLIDHNNPYTDSNGDSSSSPEGDTGAVNGTKAPMQYAIVRNNVYQLSVKSISNLPDPHMPDNPFIQVQVNVLPWLKHSYDWKW